MQAKCYVSVAAEGNKRPVIRKLPMVRIPDKDKPAAAAARGGTVAVAGNSPV